MLLRYIVSNFKSIGHPLELNMLPAHATIDDYFVKKISLNNTPWKVLRRGAFFGPNASGKSSLIESIRFARDYITTNHTSGKSTSINQFRGNVDDLQGASTFQFVFYLKNKLYEYGFSITPHQVNEEWLFQLTSSGWRSVFMRITNEAGKTTINSTVLLARKDTENYDIINVLKNTIKEKQKNQLFLYKLYDNGIKKVIPIFEWFKNLQVIFPDTTVQALPVQLKSNQELREYIGTMLKNMGTGIDSISVDSNQIDFYDFVEKVHLPKEIVAQIEAIPSGVINLSGKYFIFSENEKKRPTLLQVKFQHRINNKNIQFNMEDESDGTQRLVDLLPMLFTVGQDPSTHPTIFFVDEIDRSLHTKLSQFLLDAFLKRAPDSESQIIFTAHDVNLINTRHFSQDEIWFVEKNKLGESTIKPLSDFQVKDGKDMLKAYLAGRFGAIPMIGEM